MTNRFTPEISITSELALKATTGEILRMKNAIIILTLVFLSWFQPVSAQNAKVVRIGFLGPNSAASTSSRMESLRAGLRELGYVEGKNLVIELRWADGNYDRLPDLALDLVGLKVDLILTSGTSGTRAARSATATIPIIMVTSGDPVALGLVASLAPRAGTSLERAILPLNSAPSGWISLKKHSPPLSALVSYSIPTIPSMIGMCRRWNRHQKRSSSWFKKSQCARLTI
jgi:ABC transporter substrate binding protein